MTCHHKHWVNKYSLCSFLLVHLRTSDEKLLAQHRKQTDSSSFIVNIQIFSKSYILLPVTDIVDNISLFAICQHMLTHVLRKAFQVKSTSSSLAYGEPFLRFM